MCIQKRLNAYISDKRLQTYVVAHKFKTKKGLTMANKPANTAQKKWMDDITEWSICNLGLLYGPEYDGAIIQRHHVLGRSAKHNKVAIGHWFILPVPYELHDPNESHEFHVGHCKRAFTDKFGMQRSLFMKMYNDMHDQGYDLSKIPFEVTRAIGDTSA